MKSVVQETEQLVVTKLVSCLNVFSHQNKTSCMSTLYVDLFAVFSGDLNTKPVQYLNGGRGWMPNGPEFKCHLNTQQPNHLNTGQMNAILFSYELVRYSSGQSST